MPQPAPICDVPTAPRHLASGEARAGTDYKETPAIRQEPSPTAQNNVILLSGQTFGFEKPLTFGTNGRNGKL
jgi:hypothetical protein